MSEIIKIAGPALVDLVAFVSQTLVECVRRMAFGFRLT
jgi:hypothetical protein